MTIQDERSQEDDLYGDEPWEAMYDWYGSEAWVCWGCGEDFIDPPCSADFEDFEEYHKYARDYDPTAESNPDFKTYDGSAPWDYQTTAILRHFFCNGCLDEPAYKAAERLCEDCGFFAVGYEPEPIGDCDECDADPQLKAIKDSLNERIQGSNTSESSSLSASNPRASFFGFQFVNIDALAHTASCTLSTVATRVQQVSTGHQGVINFLGGISPALADLGQHHLLPRALSELIPVERWGKLWRSFNHGSDACVGCGSVAARPRPVVPAHLIGADCAENHQAFCDPCHERWVSYGECPGQWGYAAKIVAAALILRGRPNGMPYQWTGNPRYLVPGELYVRDHSTCQICGFTSPDPADFEHGHILSRWSAYGGTKHRAHPAPGSWHVDPVYADHPLNLVLMCKPCNHVIGKESPSLRVALRLLLKPWIATINDYRPISGIAA